ncbi:hypothetical protein [Actinomycetospora soli]|uniref:hypothetical protein n=1 Tax=Actinomycetospora soli TaxID=2893887 RepID=UPI001E60CD60|nr:hypothetical protein [Actinomycetospora soli]MCD2186135.1 hypothetical protein [Actinomycetospora soli]
MSAAAPTPEPTGLSESQQRVLDELAAHENAADPGYVLRMNAPVRSAPAEGTAEESRAGAVDATVARGRRRDVVVQLAVVGVIVALVLPLAWTVALLLTVALVVGPTYLVVKALRDGGLEPPAPRPDPDRP